MRFISSVLFVRGAGGQPPSRRSGSRRQAASPDPQRGRGTGGGKGRSPSEHNLLHEVCTTVSTPVAAVGGDTPATGGRTKSGGFAAAPPGAPSGAPRAPPEAAKRTPEGGDPAKGGRHRGRKRETGRPKARRRRPRHAQHERAQRRGAPPDAPTPRRGRRRRATERRRTPPTRTDQRRAAAAPRKGAGGKEGGAQAPREPQRPQPPAGGGVARKSPRARRARSRPQERAATRGQRRYLECPEAKASSRARGARGDDGAEAARHPRRRAAAPHEEPRLPSRDAEGLTDAEPSRRCAPQARAAAGDRRRVCGARRCALEPKKTSAPFGTLAAVLGNARGRVRAVERRGIRQATIIIPPSLRFVNDFFAAWRFYRSGGGQGSARSADLRSP